MKDNHALKRPVMKRLTIQSLIMNRKRTIVTIVGILLATALITAVASMAVTFQWSLVEYEKTVSGDFDYEFINVPKDEMDHIEHNRNVESYYETANIGYSLLEGGVNVDKPYLFLLAMDENAMKNSTVELVEGRMPENEHEVLISKHIKTNGGVSYKVGDTLSMNIGQRKSEDGKELTQETSYYEDEKFEAEYKEDFTVVGITERLSYKMEDYSAPGYTVITYLNSDPDALLKDYSDKVNIYTTYTSSALKDRVRVTAEILGVSPELMEHYLSPTEPLTEEEWDKIIEAGEFKENSYLIRYKTLDFRESSLAMMYSIATIIMFIIVFTSVFCIRNSFAISITEKMKQYGMLASVGATPRQIKKNVYYEAFWLGLIGIPLGLASGVFATWVVVRIVDQFFTDALRISLVFHSSWGAIIAGTVLAVATIFLSAIHPAKRAAKVSPIVAMNGNEDVKIQGNEVKSPAWVRKIFGMGGTIAYKNMKRNRKKYRVSVISIAVSVTIFVAMHSFIQTAFRSVDYYTNNGGYNIGVWVSDWSNMKDSMEQTLDLDGVKEAAIIRWNTFTMANKDIPYTDEALASWPMEEASEYAELQVLSVGDRAYKEYVEQLGLDYDVVKNQGILMNESYEEKEGKRFAYESTNFKKGDVISGVFHRSAGMMEDGTPVDVEGNPIGLSQKEKLTLAAVTIERPYGMERNFYPGGLLIVSDECMDAHDKGEVSDNMAEIRYNCEDPDAMQEMLETEYSVGTDAISNLAQEKRKQESFCIVIAIFLYGFIAVISLIGITNIFNTITTSMELRSKEFAMLRSIGMTSREFEHMVRMESVFYGGKALAIGVVLGTGFAYLIYTKVADEMSIGFQIPVMGIMISIAAVFVLLAAIMRYSIHKIRKQNIIETIRQDNV